MTLLIVYGNNNRLPIQAESRCHSGMKTQIGKEMLRLVGQRIRAIRRGRGISQEELAARAEIHPTYLSAVECGKRNPSMMIFFSIAAGLDVSPSDLLTSSAKVRHGDKVKGQRG
jgi:DNA-binding XRE family transcriptional regulator